jgi:hypothetical protein
MADVKNCPFCGGEAVVTHLEPHEHSDTLVRLTGLPKVVDGAWTVECQECPCGLIADTHDGVMRAWNRRAPQPAA